MKIFSLDHRQDLSLGIAERLGVGLSPVEIRQFDDGEFKIRPLISVAGDDVSIIATFVREGGLGVHEKLCLALFLASALRGAHAQTVQLITPYLCYARKDQRTKMRDPLTLRYVATLLEAAGFSGVVAMDVHNTAAFESAFRVPVEHLSARDLLASRLATMVKTVPVTLMSPDFGGAKRVFGVRDYFNKLRGCDDTKFGLVVKERSFGEVKGGPVLGDVKDRVVILFDDLISSGGTINKAARSCLELGANKVLVAATHIILGDETIRNLGESAIDFVLGTNTTMSIESVPTALTSKFELIDVSRQFAKTSECTSRLDPLAQSPTLA